MISLDNAAHVAELIGGISTTVAALGVGLWLKRFWNIGRAIAHLPEMLHGHGEREGVLTTAGIAHPFREGAD